MIPGTVHQTQRLTFSVVISNVSSEIRLHACKIFVQNMYSWFSLSHEKLTANFLHGIKCRTAQFRVAFSQFIEEGWTVKVGKQK